MAELRIAFSWTFILVFALTLASCAGVDAPDILTTSTVLADVTRNVVGDRFSVGSLLPVGVDPHSYQPTAQDTAKISESKVLVINGADYEAFLGSLIESNRNKPVIDVSSGVHRITNAQNGASVDPHFWLDPNNVISYVENILEGMAQFDPQGADVYEANANAYIAELQELDAWINGQIAQIDPQRRLLITNHETLGYFADRYGFRVVGTVLESPSSDASPSAEQMAGLIEQIRLYEAPAIFLDTSDNPQLAQQIAAETGVNVVTDLHFESLTDGAPAATYIDMMRDNVTKIIEALK